jgi:hypothetical protein
MEKSANAPDGESTRSVAAAPGGAILPAALAALAAVSGPIGVS